MKFQPVWIQIWGWPLAAVIFLALAVLKTSAHLETNMDLRLYDESYYLTQGFFYSPTNWLADYSPLYSLYYNVLSFIEQDAISLYYLNYRVWAGAFSLLIFWILFLNGVHPGMALLWATTSLCAQTNYLLWPKAGHFAMVGVGLALMGLQRFKFSQTAGFLWVAGFSALLAWVRPEFAIGAIAGFIFWAISLFRIGISKAAFRPLAFLPLIFASIFFLVWGAPIGRSGRGNVAFGQHFVHNLSKIEGKKADPLYSDWVNWRAIFSQSVGNPDEMVSTFFRHPEPLFSHLWQNIRQFLSHLPSYFFETLVPVHWLGFSVFFTLGLLWFLAELANGFNGLNLAWKKLRAHPFSHFLWLIPLAIPPITAGLLFQPRPHYLLPLFPFLVWGLSIWMSSLSFSRIPGWAKTTGLVSLLMVAFVFLPDSSAFFRVQQQGVETPKTDGDARYFSLKSDSGFVNISRIKALEAVSFPPGARIFDGSTGVCDFLGNRLISCGKVGFEMDYPQLKPFERFIQEQNISHILLAKTLEIDHFFRDIAFLDALKSNPGLLGWREIPLKNSSDRLFEKNGIPQP